MAIKDVLNYYNECENQYKEFMVEMEDFKILCSQGMIAPEIVENAQKMADKVEDNYKRLSYIIFLLNKPVKKEKYKRHFCQNKKLLKNSITKDEVIEENNLEIKNIKKLKEDLNGSC